MKFSRRGILGGLFAATAATAALASAPPTQPIPTPTPPPPPPPPKQTFAKGMIKPCYHLAVPCHSHSYSGAHSHGYSTAAMVTDYEIFDGEKFVPFNSAAGQQVIADLT